MVLHKATDLLFPVLGLILPLWALDTPGLGPSGLPFFGLGLPNLACFIFSTCSGESFLPFNFSLLNYLLFFTSLELLFWLNLKFLKIKHKE